MLALAVLLIAADAPAPAATAETKPPPKAPVFATPGDMVWTSGTSFRFSASAPMLASRPEAMPTATTTANEFSGEATLALALDYFLVKRVSLGAFVRAGYAWSPIAYGPGFGAGPRVGYLAPFNDWVGVWPRLDLSFGAQATFVRPGVVNPPPEGTLWFLNIAAHLPLVFTFLQHVVLGIGPYFALEPQWMQGQPQLAAFALNFGVSSFIGWHH